VVKKEGGIGMIAIDDYGDLVDESNPPPFWEWMILGVVVLAMILDGCMRRGV
jgi:hypothetical protein